MNKLRTFFFTLLTLVVFILGYVVYKLYNDLNELKAIKSTQKVELTTFTKAKKPITTTSDLSLPNFRDVARFANESVVYIESEVNMRAQVPEDGNHQFDDSFWDRFGMSPRSTSLGSGVIISNNGFILTNNHVIEGAINNKVTVVLNDNRSFNGDIIGTDPATDLAVVKIESNDLRAMVLGDSDDVQIGDWVLAVGNPFRLRSTVTAGIVSAMSRDMSIIEDRMRIENFIQTDAAINKGNSGGALIDANGSLIGINTAIATKSGSYEGYGFAIPINMASKIARDIIEFGEVQRAYLGVQIVSISAQSAQEYNLPEVSGVEIISTVEGGAARRSGVQSGDVVLAINERKIEAHNQLQAKIAEFRPGEEITLTVWRNQSKKNIQVELQGLENNAVKEWLGYNDEVEDQESQRLETPSNPEYEIDAIKRSDLDKYANVMILQMLTFENRTEVYIKKWLNDSVFSDSGLQPGDQLLSINSKPIRTITDFKIHIQHYSSKKEPITIKVKRDGKKIGYFTLPEQIN